VNLKVISSIKHCLERRIPILCVLGSTDNERCFARIRPRLLASSIEAQKLVLEHVIQGADHDFLEPEHSRELVNTFIEWLARPDQPWSDRRTEYAG
jgi:hypothetical protein